MSLSSTPSDLTLGAEQTAGESSARPVDLASGHVIGRHVVVDRLGAGAMGVVYAAYDPELDRRIAIKVLREPAAAGTPRRTRMLREAQALARLAHPNVVAIHDVGTLDERVWIAMEYVEGETLAVWRKRARPTWREVVAVMSAAGRGLAAAHAVGLVHRDVKPDNVMVGKDGRVRVMDFGLAFAVASGDAFDPASESSRLSISSQAQTLAGALLGTPGYMPPEQLHHREIDASSDQFAFCVTLWEACYGTKAFSGTSIVEISANVLEGRIAAPPADARVPRWLRDVALRGMAADPAQRFASMAELLDALDRGQTRARRRIFGAVAAVLVVGGLAAWASHASRERAHAAACRDEGSAIAASWPGEADARSEAIATAIRGTGVPFAERTIARIDTDLRDYATAWSEARENACMREDDDALRTAVIACLEDRRDAFAAMTDLFAAADRNVATAAVSAVAYLPRLSECDDPGRYALGDVGADPAQRALERDVRGRLARLGAVVRAGRRGDTTAEAKALVDDAKSLGSPTIIARAHAMLGDSYMRASKFEEATVEMRTSFTISLAAGADTLAADTAATLAFAIGYRLGRIPEGRQWIAIADALLQRADAVGTLAEGRVRHHEGILLALAGEATPAIASLERAIEVDIAAHSNDHPTVAGLLSDLGGVLAMNEEYERALQRYGRALEIYEATFGPDHPIILSTLINAGAGYGELGQNERARAVFERALAIAEQSEGPQHALVGTALQDLAITHDKAGAPERALPLMQRSLAIRQAVFPPDHPEVAAATVALAEIEIALARYDDALGHLRAAQAIMSDESQHRPRLVAALGRVHLGKDELPEAIAALERASTMKLSDDARGFAQLALADALRRSNGDMERARALVREAKDRIAQPGQRHERLVAEVDAWLAAHG